MNKRAHSSLVRKILLSLGFFVAIPATVELAFHVRNWRDRLSLDLTKPGQKNILLIGDSVLGTGYDAGLARYLTGDLQKSDHSFVVTNLARPGTSSKSVRYRIDSYIASYRPEFVVLLLGKSDFNEPIAVNHEADSWLARLKVVQIARMAYDKALGRLLLFRPSALESSSPEAIRNIVEYLTGEDGAGPPPPRIVPGLGPCPRASPRNLTILFICGALSKHGAPWRIALYYPRP